MLEVLAGFWYACRSRQVEKYRLYFLFRLQPLYDPCVGFVLVVCGHDRRPGPVRRTRTVAVSASWEGGFLSSNLCLRFQMVRGLIKSVNNAAQSPNAQDKYNSPKLASIIVITKAELGVVSVAYGIHTESYRSLRTSPYTKPPILPMALDSIRCEKQG